MSDENSTGFVGSVIFLVVVLIVASFVAGLKLGWDWSSEATQEYAVRDGRGKWIADEKGRPAFEWIRPLSK